jgi:hypothetical protein
MKFTELIETVPDYKRFFTVEEMDRRSLALAEKYPDRVKVYEAGKSRAGHPIYVLEIGKGSKNALLFGCPHPNEPIGAMMLDYLSERLASDDTLLSKFDYTWHMIKVIDVDGTKLNEGWFNDSSSIRKYAANFYRPPGHEQVEWTFPIDYKTLHFHSPLPETEVLMKLMEDKKPQFMYSLHNSGFGGVYYYISDDIPELYETFNKLPGLFGLPLNLGEPEAPYLKELAPAIFKLFGMAQDYDYLEKNLGPDKDPASVIKAGTSSDDYASSVADTFSLVCEMPYYYDPRVEDQSEADISRKEALRFNYEKSVESFNFSKEIMTSLEPEIRDRNSPFYRVFKNVLETYPDQLQAQKNWIENDPSLERKAKKAEVFDNKIVSQFYQSLMLGMLRRLIAENNDGSTKLNAIANMADEAFERKIEYLEENLNYTTIPIKSLVCVQLLAGLNLADYLQRKSDK